MTIHEATDYKTLDPATLPTRDIYKVMTGCIVPRPIALVTSLTPDGVVNAAPFSYYQGVSSDPPLISLSLGRRNGIEKDTLANARANGTFVVNSVSEEMAEAMNVTSFDYARDESEVEAAGFHLIPGEAVETPRIAESPIHLECRLYKVFDLGRPDNLQHLIIGEVVRLHLRADLLDDRYHVDSAAWKPLARLGGPGYATLGETYTMERPTEPEPRK